MEEKSEEDNEREDSRQIYSEVTCFLKPEVINAIKAQSGNIKAIIEETTGVRFIQETSICGTWSEVELARHLLDEMISVSLEADDSDDESQFAIDATSLQIGNCQHEPCRWRSEVFPVSKEIIQFMILCLDEEMESLLDNHALFVASDKDEESASVQCCGEDIKEAESSLERFKHFYKSTGDRLWIGEFPYCTMLDDRFCQFLLKRIECVVLSDSNDKTIVVCDRKVKDKVTSILHKICAALHDESASQPSDNTTAVDTGVGYSSSKSDDTKNVRSKTVSTTEQPSKTDEKADISCSSSKTYETETYIRDITGTAPVRAEFLDPVTEKPASAPKQSSPRDRFTLAASQRNRWLDQNYPISHSNQSPSVYDAQRSLTGSRLYSGETGIEGIKRDSAARETSPVTLNGFSRGFLIHNHHQVFIHKCDITKLDVDAISYIGSLSLFQAEGIAKAIYNAAGEQLEMEIRHVVNSSDHIPVGGIVVSSSGNLPCERVIHAVGPSWTSVNDQATKKQYLAGLRETFMNIILAADKYGFSSLAVPAIISGVTRYVTETEQMRIIYDVLTSTYIQILEEIHIVDVSEHIISTVAGAFVEFSKKKPTDKIRNVIELDQDIVYSIIQIRLRKMPKELKIYNRVKILIYIDDITKLNADAIVCPNDNRLSCYKGLAKRIADIVGSEYKQLCKNAVTHKKLEPSDVVAIHTDCLGIIINAVVPHLSAFFGRVDKYSPDAYKDLLCSSVKKSIEEARKYDICTLAMFPLGIGQEHVSNSWIAEMLCQALQESVTRDEKLKEIHIVDTNTDFLALMWSEIYQQTNDITDTSSKKQPSPVTRRAMDQASRYKESNISKELFPVKYSERNQTSKPKESNMSKETFAVTYTLREQKSGLKETNNSKDSFPMTYTRQDQTTRFKEHNISKDIYSIKHSAPAQTSRLRKANISKVSSNKLPSRPQPQVTLLERSVSSAVREERKEVALGSRNRVPVSQAEVHQGFLIGGKFRLYIHICSITELEVDAIVNAANSLLHHGRGFAKEIARAAGPELEKEGREIIRRSGPIPITTTVVTSAGRLSCKKIIHAVGPWWPFAVTDEKEEHCFKLLRETINNILQTAVKQGFRTLAMPAIISGGPQMPKHEVARVTCDALTDSRSPILDEIHLVCATDDEFSLFTGAILEIKESRPASSRVIELAQNVVSSRIQKRVKNRLKELLILDQVKVLLYSDDITKIKADAIVCANDEKLSCSTGLAKKIADSLGREYPLLCIKAAKDKKLRPKDVVSIKTNTHGLIINIVVHDLSSHIQFNDIAYKEQLLRYYRNIFSEAKKHRISCLAMSIFDNCRKYFSNTWQAGVMCEALMAGINSAEELKEIHIVDKNREFLMALWDELKKQVVQSTSSDNKMQLKLTQISAPNPKATCKEVTVTKAATLSSNQTRPETRPQITLSERRPFAQVTRRRTERSKHLSDELVSISAYKVPCGFLLSNKIKVFIHRCDITKIQVDAIVNAANRTLQHDAGVAKAIADAAGPDLEEEGREIINNSGPIPVSQTVVTSAGNLPCAKVIHAVRPEDWAHSDDEERQKHCLELLRDTFRNILQTADKCGIRSLAIPAVFSSTGMSSKDDAVIIYEMVASVFGLPKYKVASITCEVLINTYTDHLKEVHVVDTKCNILQLISGAFYKMSQLKTRKQYCDVIELRENTISDNIQKRVISHLTEIMLQNNITVFFSSETITKLKADAILCFNDENLSCSVGLAKTVADLAGEQYQKQCRETAHKKKIRTSDIVCIRTENLGIIINAILPSEKRQYTKVEYKEVIYSSLEHAFQKMGKYNISRLVISPTGIDRNHLPEVWLAEAMCQAIIDVTKADVPLKEIYIVDFNNKFIRLIRSELSKQMQVSIIGRNVSRKSSEAERVSKDEGFREIISMNLANVECSEFQPPIAAAKTEGIDSSVLDNISKWRCEVPCGFLINGRMQVLLHTCDLTSLQVDAVVDLIGPRPGSGRKAVSTSVPVQVSPTTVTSAGDLACKLIIHAVCPSWSTMDPDTRTKRCLQLLRSTLINILHAADECAITSLGIPAPTAGMNAIPSRGVAPAIYEDSAELVEVQKREIARTVCEVLVRTKSDYPKKVHLVDSSDDFLSLIGGCFVQMTPKTDLQSEFHAVIALRQGLVTSIIQKCTRGKPREVLPDSRVKVFVYCGDITALTADAIVCSNDEKLSCSTGLAKRIASLAGNQYKLRCKQAAKGKKLRPSDVVSIRTDNLGLIINVVLPRITMFTKKIKKYDVGVYRKHLNASFRNALDEARRHGISCLAMSPLGGGQKLIPNFWIADAMYQIIQDVIKSDRQTEEIHVVDTNEVLVMVLKSKLEKIITSVSESSLLLQQIIQMPNYQLPCGFQMRHGLQVFIHESDITRLKTDAIVSWTNKTLDHSAGIAKTIFNAGGSRLEEMAKKLISRLGPVPISEAVVTYAGSLPCKMVIHAVVPNWQFLEDGKKKKLLRKTFINLLRKADKYAITSLGVPAFTSGITKVRSPDMPKQELARIICGVLSAIKCNELKEVHLVDISDKTLLVTGGCFSQMSQIKEELYHVAELGNDVVSSTIQKRVKAKSGEKMSRGRVELYISCGDITQLKADAIICSNDKKLSCSKGLAKYIADLAGKQYKKRCKEAAKGKKLHSSDVVSIRTKDFGIIINVVLPRLKTFSWKLKKPDPCVFKRIIHASYQHALDEARKHGVTCLAISPLGTGQRRIPNAWIVEAIGHFIGVLITSEKQLKEIYIVDTSNVLVTRLKKSLNKYLSSDTVGQSTKLSQQVVMKDFVANPSRTEHPLQTVHVDTIASQTHKSANEESTDSAAVAGFPVMNYKTPCGFLTANGIQVLIHECDITKLKTDAIVSWSNKTLDQSAGITKAIFDAGGSRLEEMARKVIKRLGPVPVTQAVVTYAGNLSCKMVIHAVPPNWHFVGDIKEKKRCLKLLRKTIINILRTADKYVITSLGIPAVIRGIFGATSRDTVTLICGSSTDLQIETKHNAAKMICDVLARKQCKHLNEVHLVDDSDDILSLIGGYFFESSKENQTKQIRSLVKLDHHVTSSAIQRRVKNIVRYVKNPGRVKVFISRGNIMEVNADAVVCFNDKTLSCSNGLAKRIADKVGKQYKLSCEKAAKERTLNPSDVVCIKTKNQGLIINIIAPCLPETSEETKEHTAAVYKKLLRVSFKNAIDRAVEYGASRLAIAPYSFEQQCIPSSWVADAICKILLTVLKIHQQIKEIHLVERKGKRVKILYSQLKKHISPYADIGITLQQNQAETKEVNFTASLNNYKILNTKSERMRTQTATAAKQVSIESSSHKRLSISQHRVPCGFLISGKLQVVLHKSDIKMLLVDAIVHFTNTNFEHAVGIGKAIFEAAGAELERDIRDIIARSRPMSVSTTVITSAGRLPCKKVIHAVGPIWPFIQDKEKRRKCLTMMLQTYINIIKAAEESGCKTLAVPAIVSGIVGVPKHDVAAVINEMIVSVFKVPKHELARIICKALASVETNNLEVIYLVDTTEELLALIGGYFVQMSKKKLHHDLHEVTELEHDVVSSKIRACLKRRRKEFLIYNRVKIFVYCDDIMMANTDAVVCSNDGRMTCSTGLAKHIAELIGKSYKSRCSKAAKGRKLKPSDVVSITTERHGVIINVIVPQYKQWSREHKKSDGDNFTQLLRASFQNAIEEAKKCGVFSLALSPLGADQEDVPNYCIVDALCQTLKEVTESDRQFKEIHIVDRDKYLLTLFKNELMKHFKRPSNIQSAARQPASIPKCSIPCGFLTMNIIEVFIHKCDITEIQVDAIVNHTDSNLDQTVGVAKAISDAAGPEMEKERRKILRSSGPISEPETVVTSAGRLPCKIVIHAVGPKWTPSDTEEKKLHCFNLLRDTFINILNTADKHGVKTLAIPAVTSGILGVEPNKAKTLVREVILYVLQIPRHIIANLICEVITNANTKMLREVHLVDKTDRLLSLLAAAFLEKNKSRSRYNLLEVIRLDENLVYHAIRKRVKRKQKVINIGYGFKVFIHCDRITKIKADAVVCPNDQKLSCSTGPAKDIADSAEVYYKWRCTEAARKRTLRESDVVSIHTVTYGDIINVIVPCLLPSLKNTRIFETEARKDSLKACYVNALNEARRCGSSSLVLYPIGADDINIPKSWLADAICRALSDSQRPDQQLKEVHIVHMDNELLSLLWTKLKKHFK